VGARPAHGLLSVALAALAVACSSATASHGGSTAAPPPPAPASAPAPVTAGRPRPVALTRPERLGHRLFFLSGCADCHTLAEAGAHGRVGPDLDRALAGLSAAQVVRVVSYRVRVGGGGMFPFGIGMAPVRIHRVALYVARAVTAGVR
jgi:mono/diheme cytochrome c family protein